MANPLPGACAGMDSNHRCQRAAVLQTAAFPLCHRRVCPRGVEPRNTRVTAGSLSRLGQDTVLSKGVEPVIPAVWTRCSAIELAERACSQEDSNLHRQLRRLA